MNDQVAELKAFYARSSKHSNYQILSKRLSQIIGKDDIEVKTRFEAERLQYILKNVDVKGKTILDIGGNTGYFSFELLENDARKLYYYEGNKTHADFVQLAANVLGVQNDIVVTNDYFVFENEFKNDKLDIVLLLNVLHHIGDDYGDEKLTINMAKHNIIKQLNSLANKTSTLVFQLGFNWKGNRDLGLFEGGSKAELIDFIREGVKNYWSIETIGIAEFENESIVYNNLNENNIKRNDKLGEFLNRPIFILKSLVIDSEFNSEEEKSFLNSLVGDYKDVSPYSQIKKDIILDLIDDLIKPSNTDRALVLGCSHGYETEQLSKRFERLDVVDGSSVFIEKLKKESTYRNVNFTFSLFEEFIAEDNLKYDYIFCNYVLEHVQDPIKVLKQVQQSLKPNGLISIVVPNSNALSRRIAKEMMLINNLKDLTDNDRKHGHRRVYDKNDIEFQVKSVGLDIVNIKGIVLKILSDFQLNKLLSEGFLTKEHIYAMQKLALKAENIEFCDSFFILAQKINNSIVL